MSKFFYVQQMSQPQGRWVYPSDSEGLGFRCPLRLAYAAVPQVASVGPVRRAVVTLCASPARAGAACVS